MSVGALVKAALPETRVLGPEVHASHHVGAFLRSLGSQSSVTSVLLNWGWRSKRGCHLLPCLSPPTH